MKRGVIDRFEGELAVLEFEDGTHETIKKQQLPQGVVEGDAVLIDGESITIDKTETKRLRDDVEKLMNELFK